nr:hypothetical protein [Tanacetum cinerariifolium]
MDEEQNNLIETPILNDYDDSIAKVDPNIIMKEVVKDINKSSAEYTKDNSNDEDNEDSHSAEEEQNTKDSDSVKTSPVKKSGRPKNINYIKMIKEKCYNIHQDLISVREKLDEGLSRFPDCKKHNMFRKKFKKTTTGIDNDNITGIYKESESLDCQMESDSPASDDDNQKSDFQVLFHKESGNSDLQSMKNKERNEDVHHILNEDDTVDDSCPATGFCSVIEGDEVGYVEKEKQQIGNEDDRVVDDSDTTIPYSVTEGKVVKFIKNDNVLVDDVPNEMIKCSFEVQKKYSLNECDAVIQDENKVIVQDSVERSAKVVVDSQHTIEDIFKQDEQIQSAGDVGCSIPDLDDAKLDIYNGPNLRSNLDLIFESQSGLGLNHLEMETLTLTLMVSAYIPVYYIGKDTDDEKLVVYKKMKESFNEDEKLMSLQNFEMVFFPVCHEDHIYLICVDLNKGSIHLIENSASGTDHKNQKYKGIPQAIRKVFVQYLYYVKHPKAEAIEKAKIKRMKMSWRTTRNSTDCGVFTMLHMESYIGAEGEWKCGLAKESKNKMNN